MSIQNIILAGLFQNKKMERVWMDKQRDIIIERLEQKLKERDQVIAEMVGSTSVDVERIVLLETKVKELKEDMHGILDELLYQKAIIEEMQQKLESNPKNRRNIRNSRNSGHTEYIIAESTPKAHSERGEQGEVIITC